MVVVGAGTVVVVTGTVVAGADVVVGTTRVVVLAENLVVVVVLLLVELRVASAVIPTAASATMATMTTIIHPLSSGDFFSAPSEASATYLTSFSIRKR
jgi:hypothetical protein